MQTDGFKYPRLGWLTSLHGNVPSSGDFQRSGTLGELYRVGNTHVGPKKGTPPKTEDMIQERALGNLWKQKLNEMRDVISGTDEATCIPAGKSRELFLFLFCLTSQ